MRSDMVTAYVRDLLERLTGDRPELDQDGDLGVVFGGASFYVRVVNPTDPVVQVFCVAVAELAPSLELMGAINEINQRIGFARAFHVADQVLFESEIWGSDINPGNFQHACRNIASAADQYAPQLVESFGGTPRFEASKAADYPEPELSSSPGYGMYL